MALPPTPRVTTTVVYPAGSEPVTVSSTGWHRPTISPFGAPASLSFRDARHASNDAYVVGAASMGLQTAAWPGLQESKSNTAAVAGSIVEAPLRPASTRIEGLCCTGSPGGDPLPRDGGLFIWWWSVAGLAGTSFPTILRGHVSKLHRARMARDPIKHLEAQHRYLTKNREKVLARKRSPEAREKKKKWRAENRQKDLDYGRRYRETHKEIRAAAKKAWRLANPEKVVAYYHAYRAGHLDETRISQRKYFVEHRQEIYKKQAAWMLRKKSINTMRHDPDTVYRVVSRAVSSGLPRFMRDDVIASMLLAVLEGKLLLEHVGARMKDYVTGYNREYDTFKTLSLDAPMGGTDLRRIDLLEAPAPYEPEDDEDDDMVMLRGGQSLWR